MEFTKVIFVICLIIVIAESGKLYNIYIYIYFFTFISFNNYVFLGAISTGTLFIFWYYNLCIYYYNSIIFL